MRCLLLLTLAACGRIDFDPRHDAGVDATSDAVAPRCTEGWLDVPGPRVYGYRVTRIRDGFAIVATDAGSTFVLFVVHDDLTVEPARALQISQIGSLYGVASTDDVVRVAWTEVVPTTYHVGEFALDGTMLSARLTPQLGVTSSSGLDLAVATGTMAGTIDVWGIDATGTVTPVHVLTTASTSPSAVARTSNGFTGAWTAGTAHYLTAIDDGGTITVADRMIGDGSSMSLAWTGQRHVVVRQDVPSALIAAVYDANLDLVGGPTTLAITGWSGWTMAWNGTDIGGVGFANIVGVRDLRFGIIQSDSTLGETVGFGDGMANVLTGPSIAAGPGRFAMVWNADQQLRFAVACR
ncbi:MAG TPA: hypothetical protein VMZ53_22540 [Kofleriaceae bacterium]|nr:hypothetical protein [Kofleriaceae bacterium]